MIKKSILFRQHHFFELLHAFDPEKGPIDLFISLYLRKHPQLGSKDRVAIVERIYAYLRWKLLIETVLDRQALSGPARRDALWQLLEEDLSALSERTAAAPNVKVSFPEVLYNAIERTYAALTPSVCLACNSPAPTILRVNTLKGTRQELCALLKARGIEGEEDPSAPTALRLTRRANLFCLPEFKAGYFEVQDGGSQQVAAMVDTRPGQWVFDFCAGAGGKTLAIAPRLCGRGQLFLHDIRGEALAEAKKRLKRAGIQNAQIVTSQETDKLRALRQRMDWVLVDAPCTGTGTLRRNPDMKWKFSEEMLARLVEEQRAIFAEAFSYVKPGGAIVYATCSLLKEENEEQQAYFLSAHPLELALPAFRSLPGQQGMDGFFAVCFRRT